MAGFFNSALAIAILEKNEKNEKQITTIKSPVWYSNFTSVFNLVTVIKLVVHSPT